MCLTERKLQMTDFEKKVIEVLSEKPFILTEYGEITTDKRYIIDKNENTRYVFSRKTNTLILAIGDSKEDLEEAYKKYRKKIDDIKCKLSGGFFCTLECRSCDSFMRVACFEIGR